MANTISYKYLKEFISTEQLFDLLAYYHISLYLRFSCDKCERIYKDTFKQGINYAVVREFEQRLHYVCMLNDLNFHINRVIALLRKSLSDDTVESLQLLAALK